MFERLLGGLTRKWLFVFALSALVQPEILGEVPGPSNDENLPKAKRRRLAACKFCSFVAKDEVELDDHECSRDSGESPEPPSESTQAENESNEASDRVEETQKPKNRIKMSECLDCGSVMRADSLKRHRGKCKIRCGICGKKVAPLEMSEHKNVHELNLRYSFPDSTSGSQSQNQAEEEEEVDSEFQDIYEEFGRFINTFEKTGRIMDTYNFKSHSLSPAELVHRFKSIFRRQKNAFKVKISLGVILFNKTTKEYAYYKSSQNNQLLLDDPVLIRNTSDKVGFIEKLKNIDLAEAILRPNSQWTVAKVTNVSFFVFKLTGTPIGSPIELPPHLERNRGLRALLKNKRGQHYKDNLCFFRCLSLHMGFPLDGLEKKTKELAQEYSEKASIKGPLKMFPGVTLDQLEDISRIFNTAINVYEQDEERNTDLVFRSTLESKTPLNMNIHGVHFSYIEDLNKYSQSYRCMKCDKLWTHSGNYHRHIRSCEAGIKQHYGSGTFEVKPTVFEELEKDGVFVPPELRPFPFRATYDVECLLKEDTDIDNTEKISYTSKHELASISICSNVPGFNTPKCFVLSKEGEQKALVKEALDYLMEISEMSSVMLRDRYSEYLEQITSERTLNRFEQHISQLPVLSFNGASYDLRVLRKDLIPVLVDLDSLQYVIKKNSSYMAIVTEELRFLDITYYLAPSFNYSQFLRAYGAKECKGYFPYDWFSALNKLDSKTFPAYQDFYSSLKGKNTLEPSPTEALTPDEIEHIGRKPSKNEPLTSEEVFKISQFRFEAVSDLFYNNKWTMREYLIHYNNADVKPFLIALENLSKYYTDRGVDVFKDGMSVPGIAERIAFGTLKSDENFVLFNKRNADLVDLFRRNNVGGPAIIFDRYQEAGVTKIRHDPTGKECKKILGFDANALYLWCMQQLMPCGIFIRRKSEDMFEKKYPKSHSGVCCEWLSYLEASRGLSIQHARNGKEFKVGSRKISVDGFCRETNTVFQFQGCYYHGCETCFAAPQHNREEAKNGWKSYNDRFKATQEISKYITDEGYTLEEIWECQWRKLKKSVTVENKYLYPGEDKVYLRETEILQMVRDGRMFGAIEVDIEVPGELRKHFGEMTPIFKNCTITAADIGDNMTQYLEYCKKSFSERKCLIGSMYGEKILLITPLLQWYMDHGLRVTKVYQIIQFDPKACFKSFGEQVSDDRRAGDADASKKVIAETSKLIGNSVYGHSIMNKAKHTTVKFCGIEKASKLINSPFFTTIDEFDGETFELTMKKSSIKHDLPVQLGYFVYQYAKMRMLAFYYDVVDHFVDRRNYCLLEMDTDSLYMAVTGDSLDDMIKPGLEIEWQKTKTKWFPRTENKTVAAYDLRTPGLFKMEWSGDGFVGLAAKTYYCFDNKSPSLDKHSAKGVNRNFKLTKEDYLKVLNKEKDQKLQLNKGFIMKGQSMFTYELTKRGLDNLYVKRKVLNNGFSTTYLDL